MLTKNHSYLGFALVFALFAVFSHHTVFATPLSSQEILDSLKGHQDKVKSIEADFAMTVFGVDGFKLEQSGTYSYEAPDKVRMEFVTPRPQVVKTEKGKSYISVNNGAFKEVPTSEQSAGMNTDIFQYAFLKQFYLDIDMTNKPSQGHLYKVLGYHKNEEGNISSKDSVLNAKAIEFIYDSNRGLVTKMNFTGTGPMPPIEVQQVYEQKNGCWVPKSVFTKVITPGGAISSIVKMDNKTIEKQ
jgi:outer membrane lipoprotein-sorting protein